MRHPIRAVLFDLDDTLLETYPAHQACIRTCCARTRERYPECVTERLHEEYLRGSARLAAQRRSGELQVSDPHEYRTLEWRTALEACGLPLDLAPDLAHLHREERRSRHRLFEEVPDVLRSLGRRYRLALVTNGLSELQREKIVAVGLENWIAHIAVSGELGSWKPHAAIFQHALELLQVSPEETVMVGDSLECDVRGAQALGMRTVWLRRYDHLRPDPDIQPDRTLTDIRELESELSAWQ